MNDVPVTGCTAQSGLEFRNGILGLFGGHSLVGGPSLVDGRLVRGDLVSRGVLGNVVTVDFRGFGALLGSLDIHFGCRLGRNTLFGQSLIRVVLGGAHWGTRFLSSLTYFGSTGADSVNRTTR